MSHWSRISRGVADVVVEVLNESSVQGRNTVVRNGQQCCYLHVDDGLFFGDASQPSSTDRTMERCAQALVEVGFTVDNNELNGNVSKIIGYAPQRSPARLNTPAAKAVLISDALRHLAKQQIVAVDQVRAVLGVWIWGALLRRELLAVPQTIF